MEKAVVLGADNGYLEKVEVTIKSVAAHNTDIHFYILNDDIPSEWFRAMNRRLKVINSKISNIKIIDHPLKSYHSPDTSRLNYAMFFRYYIPQYISESRALYLDSDIVVHNNLDILFETDLQGLPLAAVQDVSTWGLLETFNSGVMLIDTNKWREENVLPQLIELTNVHHEHVYGDQGILNMYFGQRWLRLPKTYNYMVGLDSIAHNYSDADHSWYNNDLTEVPSIIHYTAEKPWQMANQNRFKNLWWFYRNADWSNILLRTFNLFHDDSFPSKDSLHTAVFTNSYSMKHLEDLIIAFPNVHFHLLAPTGFAGSVIALQFYENVSIYPNFNPYSKKEVLKKINFYLDINYHAEVNNIVNTMHERNIPVLAFEDTTHDTNNLSVIARSFEDMVSIIKKYIS